MSLSDQINLQYNRRKDKESLYQVGDYVNNVREELKKTIHLQLKKYYSEFGDISILEIGAGNGSNAHIFESLGFNLSNIFFNELIEDRIKAIKINFPDNIVYEGDAIIAPIDKKFDIVFQSTVFSSILNQSDRVNLANRLWSLLKPGGVILWYDFIYNNPKNKDVRKVTKKELKKLFSEASLFDLKKITLAPPVGRKVKRFYKLFNVSILRSHILVLIKK